MKRNIMRVFEKKIYFAHAMFARHSDRFGQDFQTNITTDFDVRPVQLVVNGLGSHHQGTKFDVGGLNSSMSIYLFRSIVEFNESRFLSSKNNSARNLPTNTCHRHKQIQIKVHLHQRRNETFIAGVVKSVNMIIMRKYMI